MNLSRATMQALSGDIRQVIEADATSEAALRDLGVSNMNGAIVSEELDVILC